MAANRLQPGQFSLAWLMLVVVGAAFFCALAGFTGYAYLFGLAPIAALFWFIYRMTSKLADGGHRNLRLIKSSSGDDFGMNRAIIKTKNLELVPHGPQHLRALVEGVDAYERSFGYGAAEGLREFLGEASADYLARLETATEWDAWNYGFAVVDPGDGLVIGMASFKGPPTEEGLVEIAYGIAPGYQGRGFATEAAQALVEYAVGSGRVRLVRAHTLPTTNASTRVLEKCGFQRVGEVIDPEDGLVWRWERPAR